MRWPNSTRKKLKSRVFRMLLEAELITAENHILPAVFTPRVQAALAPDAPLSFEIFPVAA